MAQPLDHVSKPQVQDLGGANRIQEKKINEWVTTCDRKAGALSSKGGRGDKRGVGQAKRGGRGEGMGGGRCKVSTHL